MSPWRVALFSLLGMTAAAFSVYTLTPPPRVAASSSSEPPPLDEPLDPPPRAPTSTPPSPIADALAPLPEPRPSTLAQSPSPTTPTTPRPVAPNQAPTFATPPQVQQQQPPQQFATPPDPPGTLRASKVGGPCDFSIDGLFVASGSSIRQPLQPGPHTVQCTVPGGLSRVLSVTIKSNDTAMALFKF